MKAELLLDRPGVATEARLGRFPQLWHFAIEYLVALPLGALAALVWANADAESYFRVVNATAFFVNDAAMVLFFALMTKEIVEATAPGGVLHPWRRAALPVVASFGVTLLPIVVFAFLVRVFDEPMLVRGWPTAMAIDVALGYFAVRLIFGRHPAVAFFIVLAISANGLGFIALAGVEPIREARVGTAAWLMAAAVGTALALRRAKVRSLWPYVIAGGGLSWSALVVGGFHPALALLPIVPFLPHAARDPGFFVDAPPRASDTLNALERWCRHPSQVALFAFGLVNAGVPFRAVEAGVWSLVLATLVGKPFGLIAGVSLGSALGLHMPRGVHWRDLVPLGIVAATGFTMALFFATATVGAGQLLSELKMGGVLSVASCVAAIAAAKVLRVGRWRAEFLTSRASAAPLRP
jgi:NhaA family Na+:H+ antiporter